MKNFWNWLNDPIYHEAKTAVVIGLLIVLFTLFAIAPAYAADGPPVALHDAREAPHDRTYPDNIERRWCGYIATGRVKFWRPYKLPDLIMVYGAEVQCPVKVDPTEAEMGYPTRARPKDEERRSICLIAVSELRTDNRMQKFIESLECDSATPSWM